MFSCITWHPTIEFQPDIERRPAQAALHGAWRRLWEGCGSEWLHCYDIPGLPPDNLALESLFGRLRNHQRRISGRKSTRKLRGFGQCQVLFLAEADYFIVCTAIHLAPCVAWSIDMPLVTTSQPGGLDLVPQQQGVS